MFVRFEKCRRAWNIVQRIDVRFSKEIWRVMSLMPGAYFARPKDPRPRDRRCEGISVWTRPEDTEGIQDRLNIPSAWYQPRGIIDQGNIHLLRGVNECTSLLRLQYLPRSLQHRGNDSSGMPFMRAESQDKLKAAGEKAEMEPGVLGRARDPDALPSKSALEKFSLKVASGVGFSGLLRIALESVRLFLELMVRVSRTLGVGYGSVNGCFTVGREEELESMTKREEH
ncbi:hypothetical protein EDD18DRAFT_1325886 [Armillaria luteobubalina]|uniref:Uncharacterized protein n=1 Tax=Armillaria luteobubalina TaxID=153913 RepID=A0AA39V127_9AGAR|nr:hypothetical protein EDD18DRAFT_1325886 [Armillaria luteobubalina]